jgi:short-subunit dehydrogenase
VVALVTGASSGIGEHFARQLAQRGYDLVLVARRRERLEELADELPVKVHVLPCDLSCDFADLPGRVAALGVDVDLLVNNAGFGTWGRFTELDPDREIEQVQVNCAAVVSLSRALVPGMVERGRGGVITVASTAGMQPLPYEATYSATKAFARAFTIALGEELRGTGVKTLTVDPGPVATEWQEVAGYTDPDDTHGVPGKIGPEQAARESLDAFERGRRSIIPGRTIRWFMRLTGKAPLAVKLRTVERRYRP